MSPRAGQNSGILAIWETQKPGFCVEYSPGVLDAIGAAADNVPQSVSEAGGILYGFQTGTGILVHTMRPFTPEQKFGPSLRLSETDKREFTMMLDASSDPDLAGLEPVGWWVGHNPAIAGTQALDATQRDGPDAARSQVTLVIRGRALTPASADFFVRRQDGAVSREPGSSELILSGAPVPQLTVEPEGPTELVLAATPETLPAEPIEHSAARPAPERAPRERLAMAHRLGQSVATHVAHLARTHRLVGGIALAVILLAVTATVLFRQTSPPPDLGLTLADQAGQLTITWNPAALKEARRAALTIREPDVDTTVPLTERELKLGRMVYSRTAPDVTVRFQFEAGDKVRQEFVRFVGRALETPAGSGTAVQPDDGKPAAVSQGAQPLSRVSVP